MPDGFGFNGPGHSSAAAYRTLGQIGSGAAALVSRTQRGRGWCTGHGRRRQAARGQRCCGEPARVGRVAELPARRLELRPAASGASTDSLVAIIVVGLAALGGLGYLMRRQLARYHARGCATPNGAGPRAERRGHGPGLVAIGVLIVHGLTSPAQSDALASNPYLDPGTPLTRVAPAFALSDQFGQSVSLSSYRGKVVLLTFNDSECTTICPLTTTAMLDAKAMLGRAGSQIQLLGVDANPRATSVEDVLLLFAAARDAARLALYDRLAAAAQAGLEGLQDQAAIQAGEVAHTPALFVIDPQGHGAGCTSPSSPTPPSASSVNACPGGFELLP